LGIVYVDGFVVRYFLIELVRVFDWTVFYTGGTPRTFVFYDVSGLFGESNPKITCLPIYFIHFGEAENLNVRVPADLDQFR
jgi:hypothetical protein